jgi:hypothetical protein
MEPTRPLCYGRVLLHRDMGACCSCCIAFSTCRKNCGLLLRAKTAKAAATTAEVVQVAMADSLPKRVAALRELGFRGDGKTRPARFAMIASSLRALQRASKKTGLPVCRLLWVIIVQIYLHIMA